MTRNWALFVATMMIRVRATRLAEEFEIRVIQQVGWIADASWNVTDGKNLGMVRSGINFAF